MDARSLTALSLLCDLKEACADLLARKHKNVALLNLYSFMDICASLAKEGSSSNAETFQSYLQRYAKLSTWRRYTPYDLWAARCSLLHSFSPLGHHTTKPDGARPIFYFSWPETQEQLEEALRVRGYSNFLVIERSELKFVAINAFNSLIQRVEEEQAFAAVFSANAEHLLGDFHFLGLRSELELVDELAKITKGKDDA
jgi:hypothetical protein